MNNLQQIVVQETTVPYVRALAQYGEGIMPDTQKEIIYSELTEAEQKLWDDFIEMIKSK
jgi:hypothetical protein